MDNPRPNLSFVKLPVINFVHFFGYFCFWILYHKRMQVMLLKCTCGLLEYVLQNFNPLNTCELEIYLDTKGPEDMGFSWEN